LPRTICTPWLVFAALIAIGTGTAVASTTTEAYTLQVDLADLQITRSGGLHLIRLGDCDLIEAVGAPQLPVKYVSLAIPNDTQAVGIQTSYRNALELPGRYRIAPAPEPVPISASGAIQPETKPDPAIYSSNKPYPQEQARLIATGSLSGHRIADLAIYPVQYLPTSGKLVVYTEIEVSLELAPAPAAAIERRTQSAEELFARAVKSIVANPGEVSGQVAARLAAPADGIVEYLIITDSEYVDEFQALADWKTRKGVPTQIVTTSWIYANYSGPVHNDSQEKIRECIKDYWQTRGTVYVLLGGDVAKVPYRPAFACSGNNGEDLPCDLYYSDLDGTWNNDGDSYYGEYSADGIDMYSDVYVARAPVQSNAEAALFVNKVLQYEGEASQQALPGDYQLDMMFLASRTDDYTDTLYLKQQIDWQSVPSRFDPIDKKYQSWGNLNAAAAIQALNEGRNIINHSGHGNDSVVQTGDDYIDSGQMHSLTNWPRISGVFYSLSCYSGNFPTNDCFAENFVLAPNGGGFYVGNGHYGWYYVGNPAYGLSSRFDRYYFRALFDQWSGDFAHASCVHGEAKNYGVGVAKSNEIERFCLYELNLFGDAETPIWKKHVYSFDSVSYPNKLDTGESEFTVTVTWGEYGVPGATVCLCKGDEVYLVGTTDDYGRATFYPDPETEGEMLVTVTKLDWLPFEGSAAVEESLCEETLAPDPEPGCDGALFGEPAGGFPAWVWFSIPLDPADCCGGGDCYAPDVLLGFDCGGTLWRLDRYTKAPISYQPPFLEWDLSLGQGYMAYLTGPVQNPSYMGLPPDPGLRTKLGRQGWVWIGKPGPDPLGYPDFMDSVSVEYPVGGDLRTAAQDRTADVPWVSWGWSFWDTSGQLPKTLTPYAEFGNNTAYPWIGYRAFVNIGTAQAEADEDQVTLIWP
jgi:hypothetical protein